MTDTELKFPNDLNDEMKSIYGYWLERHDEQGRFPKLGDINLMDWHKLSPKLTVIDCLPHDELGVRFLWRYAGTALCDLFGMEMTGKIMDEVFEDLAKEIIADTYLQVYETKQPHIWQCSAGIIHMSGSLHPYSRVLFPLRNNFGDDGVGHLLGVYGLESLDVTEPDSRRFISNI